MKTKLFILVFLVFITIVKSQDGGIRAKVIDYDGNPVPIANVTLKTDKIIDGQTTNFDGWFHFKGLMPGFYNIEISFIGYGTKKITQIIVTQGKTTFLESIKLNQESIIIETATIYAEKLVDPGNIQGVKLSPEKIKTLPNNKDIGAIIEATSSEIKITNDRKQIIVRGSRPNSSSFYIDGVKMSEISNGISGNTIKSMVVYSGGIPANIGDLTGGCVIIETKSYFDFYYQWKSEQE
jgi:hypothetical protein